MTEDNTQTEEKPGASIFEAIRRSAEDGTEYWTARDLAKVLGYTEYGKFKNAINKAKTACENSDRSVSDHFAQVSEMVTIGSGAKRKVENFLLSRYACYLIVQNADPTKEIVALGQTYFATQTQFAEQVRKLEEDQRRLYVHGELLEQTGLLRKTVASQAGIIRAADFALFEDHGYMGLYAGLKKGDVAKRKGLKKTQPVTDYMSREELAANWFRATQVEAKIVREGITTKEAANQAHQEVGAKVRQTIQELGGTMPEDLPAPTESIKRLKQKQKKLDQLTSGNQT